ncbi:hypothetical protein BBJ28_00001450 [Nothophytophthora sp. Chile5]|nr:hypothetical protein BBJ28_00001450 [Nothophytophthora sp. Chile5]
MAPVPAWTKEWRPLAKELCAHVRNSSPGSHRASVSPETEDAEHSSRQETLLLRADRVVGQLYAHRFMECMPQDVQHELNGLTAKFRVHSLEERAQKLQTLAASCDFQVLKLLLELAERPTAAADEDVAVDPDTTTGWMLVWQEEQTKQMQEKQLENQLVEELFQISTNDKWYQAWEESDAEESDWEMSESEDAVESDGSVGGRRRNAKRSNAALDDVDDHLVTGAKATLDSRVSSVFATRQQIIDPERQGPRPLVERQEFSEEILLRDELLKRYYPEVSMQKGNSIDSEDEVMEESSDESASCLLANEKLVPFTMERPWLLCPTIVHDANTTRRDPPLPQKLIHEQTVVNMVFQALDGVESLLFKLQPSRPTPALFSVDFQTSTIQLSRRAQTMAVGHLSPLALYHFLEEFANAASELQLLRDLRGFIAQTREELEYQRCVTLEGLANALSEILGSLSEEICDAEQQINTPVGFEDDAAPWAGSTVRPPTLLGIYGALKENFQTISWLKQVLVDCFQRLSTRNWHEIKRAEQAKYVLDALYRMMEVEFVEGSQENEDTRSSGSWSRYDMLLHLFIGSLSPYLDLLNQMLFENGHFETIPLNGELFFTSPASLSIATMSPTRIERAQSFREGLLALAPFEVKRALVPAFLESVIGLMNEALASRQMKNRFLQHRQRTTDDYLKPPEPQQPSLRELFLSEVGEMGWSHSGRITSLLVLTDGVEAATPSSEPRVIDCMPFNRIVERCLTRHVDRKQDVFGIFSAKLVTQMQVNPLEWADSERINAFYQSAIQGMLEDNMLSTSQRQLGGQICIRIDAKHLDSSSISRKVDVATMKCLHFAFSIQQPLRVLFSAAIMQKYSRVGIFLVQVKAVESAIVKVQ